MAKRFTDTAKWDKASFQELSPKMKLVWIFLCDKCDHAGVWDINLNLMSFQIGFKVTLAEIVNAFDGKIEVRGDTKLFVPDFVEFQYGKLNPDNRVHQSVLSRLEKLAPSKAHISPLQGDKDKEQDKDKDKNKDKEEESELKKKSVENEFMDAWNSLNFGLAKIKSLSGDRKRRIASRLKEASLDDWIYAMKKIGDSRFLCGENNSGWKVDFDWLIENETNRLKIIEGKYESKGPSQAKLNEGYKHNESEDETRKALGL